MERPNYCFYSTNIASLWDASAARVLKRTPSGIPSQMDDISVATDYEINHRHPTVNVMAPSIT